MFTINKMRSSIIIFLILIGPAVGSVPVVENQKYIQNFKPASIQNFVKCKV